MTLKDFLRRSAGQCFAWGTRDCALWVCEWIECQRGVDPGAHLRETYSTEMGCAKILINHDGLVSLASVCFAGAGLQEATDLQSGDVAILDLPAGPTLGIRTSTGWAVMAADGGLVLLSDAPFIKGWSV